MSGFYSKMLINIRNLYFNNSDDMKTILHGIFLDAADVFLNGYTPSYCEENELIPTAQKFVEKFGSTKACETGVTKEAVTSAMCNPAALVALMHDSDYDVLKEAFYYAWAKHISGTLADDENNGNVINDYYIPDEGSESSCDGEDSLIFGYAEPEKIVKFAESIPQQLVDCAEYLTKLVHVDGSVLSREFLKDTMKKPLNAYCLQNALEAAIKERDDAVEDAVVNHYGDYNEDSIDIQEGANSKCICGPDFIDVWFITNLNDVDSDDLGTDYPIVEVNPEDDIKYVLEESGAYDEEIERMTENGTYEEFVRKVKEHIDWNNLQGRMIQAENETISAAIDAIINKG